MLIKILFTLTFIFASIRSEENSSDDDAVLVLTDVNFDDYVSHDTLVLVKFYAPWCGHCKSLAPVYEEAAKLLKDDKSEIRLAKLDATVHTKAATKYKVQGFPTLIFFKKGTEIPYTGPRSAQGIISWLNKKTGPALPVIENKEQYDKAALDNEVLALLYSTKEDSKEFLALSDLASKVDSVGYGLIKDANLAKELGLTESKLVLHKKFDEPKVSYTDDYTFEKLQKFINGERIPLVTLFNQESAQAVFESDIKRHVLAFSAKSNADHAKHMETLKAVATELKGKFHVVLIDMDDSDSQRVAEFLDVKSDDIPNYRIIIMEEDMKKFLPTPMSFEKAAMIKFAEDVFTGKVSPHLKSAEEPKDWNDNPVKVFVAKTFKERAVSKDRAVFVKFYAPWCGHCKQLAPIWENLAEKYASDEGIVIGKCDSTENEFEDIQVSSFPTLKFSPKGSVEWIDYQGERKLEDLVAFVDSNGKEQKPAKEESHDEL